MISIHALRKESDISCFLAILFLRISIHALRKESDWSYCRHCPTYQISIHALRKESDALSPEQVIGKSEISIHALRKESDAHGTVFQPTNLDFNPRSP